MDLVREVTSIDQVIAGASVELILSGHKPRVLITSINRSRKGRDRRPVSGVGFKVVVTPDNICTIATENFVISEISRKDVTIVASIDFVVSVTTSRLITTSP